MTPNNPLPVVLERGNCVVVSGEEPFWQSVRAIPEEHHPALRAWALRERALCTAPGATVYAVGEVSAWAPDREDLRVTP